ncbi:MAG: SAM-dependent methyltransferase [Planctomycetes bacterium]|nr:SAM-dependent methyltransferase [Planctomycetota bacterium]
MNGGIAPARVVHDGDALAWLAGNPLPADCGVLTSLPDVAEFRHRDVDRWRAWFVHAAEQVLRATPRERATVFYQTDVKRDGRWIDKAFLVQTAAAAVGVPLVWHKVVCRAPAGQATFARPGYAHLLAFAAELRDPIERATADVLPELGAMTWPRAMGLAATEAAVRWLRDVAGARTIVDPFCGQGTALAIANRLGLAAVGVELNPGRAQKARELDLS